MMTLLLEGSLPQMEDFDEIDVERLKLSSQAKEVINRLVDSQDSEKAGHIAAVDPQTGEVFYGKTITEAANEGSKRENDSKAIFFFVKSYRTISQK